MSEAFLPPIQKSDAYRQYALKDRSSDLFRLLYILDRFRNTEFQIIHDGTSYEAQWALTETRKYIISHYNDEPAEEYIKTNGYSGRFGGGLMYLKPKDGKLYVLGDVLLTELKSLRALEAAEYSP